MNMNETSEQPESAVRSSKLVCEPGRTESVKERRWWELKTRKAGQPWRYAGHTSHEHEADAFVARGEREGFDVQVWEAVAVERTEKVKKLETGSHTGISSATAHAGAPRCEEPPKGDAMREKARGFPHAMGCLTGLDEGQALSLRNALTRVGASLRG